jgi:pimeloyl-ACP methyl ester carboxylesterase
MIQYPLAVAGVLTRVLESGAGAPVVFVHGLGARADRWRDAVEAFGREGFRTIAYDLPGHGFAAKGSEFDYTVPGYADFLRALLDVLGLARVVLVGTSLGGHVAAHFACDAPARVRGLVLVGSVGLVPLGPEMGEAISRNVRLTGREAIEDKLRFVCADPALVTPALVEEEWRINNSPGAAAAFQSLGDYIAGAIDAHNVLDRLAALREAFPIRLVWGSEDRAVPPAIGEEAARRLGLPLPAVIEEAGHLPYLEQPAQFRAVLRRFLETEVAASAQGDDARATR